MGRFSIQVRGQAPFAMPDMPSDARSASSLGILTSQARPKAASSRTKINPGSLMFQELGISRHSCRAMVIQAAAHRLGRKLTEGVLSAPHEPRGGQEQKPLRGTSHARENTGRSREIGSSLQRRRKRAPSPALRGGGLRWGASTKRAGREDRLSPTAAFFERVGVPASGRGGPNPLRGRLFPTLLRSNGNYCSP